MHTLSTSPDALTIVIVEKPFVARQLVSAMRQFPAFFPSNRTVVACAHRQFSPLFLFPSKTPWKDFPLIGAPAYRPLATLPGVDTARHHLAQVLTADSTVPISDVALIAMAAEAQEFRLVCGCDADGSGSWMFARACTTLLGTSGLPRAFDLRLIQMDEHSLSAAITAAIDGLTTEDRLPLFLSKQLQRRFEFNWWLNAHALLRPAMARAGLPSSRALSKYEVQAAFYMRDLPAVSQGTFMRALGEWKGSGKYAGHGLGSAASRSQMLDNLIACEIFTAGNQVQLTEKGRAFLASLPKDCSDADLPFRLEAWGSSPAASQHKADAYLRKWFGKVKRGLPQQTSGGAPQI